MYQAKKYKEQDRDNLLVSHLTMRRTIGILGISLPVILGLGSLLQPQCSTIQSSISHYYYSPMGDVFVGVLCVVALFLFTYKGYNSKDDKAGDLACLFALGVAFFPTSVLPETVTTCIPNEVPASWKSIVHFSAAAGLFLTLAYFSYCLFTKSGPSDSAMDTPPDTKKRKRNKVYKACGVVMVLCVLLMAANFFLLKDYQEQLKPFRPTFTLESIALFAFGFSWLVKGKTLWVDRDDFNKEEKPDIPFTAKA